MSFSVLSENQIDDISDDNPHLIESDSIYSSWDTSHDSSQKQTFSLQRIFVGVLVNNEEVSSIEIIETTDDFLIPIKDILPLVQARFIINENKSNAQNFLTILIPTGSQTFKAKETYLIDGELWMSLKVLNQKIFLNGHFDSAKYALSLLPAWKNEEQVIKKNLSIAIDRKADDFSLRQLQLSHEVDYLESNIHNKRTDFLAAGAAFDGVWRIESNKANHSNWTLDEYFWLGRDLHSQWLIGKQTVSPSTISPATTLTGAHYFYSNQAIPYDSYQDITQSNFFKQLGSSIQTIRGIAQAGTIAQLYIDGNLANETFVKLDGTYSFEHVQLTSNFYNEIEVWILDSINKVIIEKQNKTQANSDSLLSEGQFVTSIALGKKGNVLAEDYQEQGQAGMFLSRYGVSDKTTLELGYLLDDNSVVNLGVTSSIGQNFLVAARVAQSEYAKAGQVEFNGYGKNWRLATYWRYEEAGYLPQNQDAITAGSLNYNYWLTNKLRLGLIGRLQKGRTEELSYIKPSIAYNYNNHLSLSVRPDSNGDYRSELLYRANNDLRLRYTHTKNEKNSRVDWDVSDSWTSYFSSRKYQLLTDDSSLQDVQEQAIGFFWRSQDAESYQYFRAEVNYKEGLGYGSMLEYRDRIASGVYFDLRVQDGGLEDVEGLSIFARLSLDFAVANGRFVPAKNRSTYNTNGTISGVLITDTKSCNIDNISLLINGYSHKVPVQGCSYSLHNIKPGIYRVSLDSEHLPIELIPEANRYVTEVKPSAVTRVDFKVTAQYSAAGQVIDLFERPVEEVALRVLNQEGIIVSQSKSDQFGYFRVDNLKPGNYTLQAYHSDPENGGGVVKILAKKQFIIIDNFLFNLNIRVQK